ncbi:STAS domain-containing protein [Planctomicrobium piriforme]|uniref:STAS domain-containing protein n=1 Tax=Planctomicrobium piriforme TaxID=1576369 RepID=A0A1I3S4N9_9PLAN|nr:STAS domain-containing protein [Planctomicrobium piriforme]SFJ53813.1 hypothetical protein SAMN05421753_12322 [Planctomicrobium piriforme]
MAERKYTHGLSVNVSTQGTVIDIGDMEIWDGADLSLIRDTLFRLVLQEGVDSFAIDMHAVQYVPSGFFGMLFDWLDRGVEVRLLNPRDRVKQMLWFRKFFVADDAQTWRLHHGLAIDERQSEELWSGERTQGSASPLGMLN